MSPAWRSWLTLKEPYYPQNVCLLPAKPPSAQGGAKTLLVTENSRIMSPMSPLVLARPPKQVDPLYYFMYVCSCLYYSSLSLPLSPPLSLTHTHTHTHARTNTTCVIWMHKRCDSDRKPFGSAQHACLLTNWFCPQEPQLPQISHNLLVISFSCQDKGDSGSQAMCSSCFS